MVTGTLYSGSIQCCQNLKSAKPRQLAFLNVASDLKVAQVLSSNHMPNVPNLGAFAL